jgi:hypothetical protein
MFSKKAASSVTGTVTSSGIQKVKLDPPKESERATRPALRVIVVGLVVRLLVSTKKLTVAFAAFFEEGKYPIFRARATTFSLNVALSMKTSLATMLALYEVMYVLYANVSIKTEKFDPSKSKSVKLEFARR